MIAGSPDITGGPVAFRARISIVGVIVSTVESDDGSVDVGEVVVGPSVNCVVVEVVGNCEFITTGNSVATTGDKVVGCAVMGAVVGTKVFFSTM